MHNPTIDTTAVQVSSVADTSYVLGLVQQVVKVVVTHATTHMAKSTRRTAQQNAHVEQGHRIQKATMDNTAWQVEFLPFFRPWKTIMAKPLL